METGNKLIDRIATNIVFYGCYDRSDIATVDMKVLITTSLWDESIHSKKWSIASVLFFLLSSRRGSLHVTQESD